MKIRVYVSVQASHVIDVDEANYRKTQEGDEEASDKLSDEILKKLPPMEDWDKFEVEDEEYEEIK